jgi:hypothetical protein
MIDLSICDSRPSTMAPMSALARSGDSAPFEPVQSELVSRQTLDQAQHKPVWTEV